MNSAIKSDSGWALIAVLGLYSISNWLSSFEVSLCFLTFYEHVIHIDLHIPTYLFAEHLVYQSLVRGTCIL